MAYRGISWYNRYKYQKRSFAIVKSDRMLIQQVRKTIKEHHLIEKEQHIVLGLSGGPDSVCLFHVLMLLKEQMGITVYPVHLNHNSDRDEAEEISDITKFVPADGRAMQNFYSRLCKNG